MSVTKEVTKILRDARRAGFDVEDKGRFFRVTAPLTGDFEHVHKTLDGKVSTHKGVANIRKFMRVQGPQKQERVAHPGGQPTIQGGECVECGQIEGHAPGCSYAAPTPMPEPETIPVQQDAPSVPEVREEVEEMTPQQTTKSPTVLKREQMRREEQERRTPEQREKFTCKLCGYVGKNAQGLSLHQRRSHGDLTGNLWNRGEQKPRRNKRRTSRNGPVTTRRVEPGSPEGAITMSLRDLQEAVNSLMEENRKLRKENQVIQDLLTKGVERLGSYS